MAALYDSFRTPQTKGEKKVRYHARSVVTGKMTTRDLIKTITKGTSYGKFIVTSTFSRRMKFLKMWSVFYSSISFSQIFA